MSTQSSIPSAHKRVARKHGTLGRFLPQHTRHFPERENNEGAARPSVPEDADVSGTGTPHSVREAHMQKDKVARSERIAAGERIVPEGNGNEWIERDEDDWLEK